MMAQVCWLIAFLLLNTSAALAVPGAGEVREGNAYFHKGLYQQAQESYEKAATKNPAEPVIDYDIGAAAYKGGEYDRAVDSFQKALLTENDKFRPGVYYNLGNALYKAGIAREDKDIRQAIEYLEKSLGNYDKDLVIDPQDQAAKFNEEFVKKELERLKKKQQEMSSQSQSKSQDQAGSQDKKSQASEQKNQKEQSHSSDQSSQSQDQKNEAGQEKQKDQQAQENKSPDQSGAEPQHGQEKKDDSSSSAGEKSGEKSDRSGQGRDGQVLSQEEAKMLLDDFEQNEQPKGLLNFIRKSRDERPVEKNW